MLYALVDTLGEEAAVLIAKKAMGAPGFKPPEYGEISEGQLEAFLNICFREIKLERLPDILAGRLVPRWKEVVRLLVDRFGRCIPDGLGHHVTDDNRNFRTDQLAFDTAAIAEHLARVKEFYPFPNAEFPSVDEAETKYQSILAWLNLPENQQNGISNLFQRPHFLGVMPKVPAGDFGETLEKLVDVAGRSYTKALNRPFENYRSGSLTGQVTLAEVTRYSEFVKAVSEGPVIWVAFRACLQGFFIPADREQEVRMPGRFILSGGWDTAMDVMAYPEVLLRDYLTPGLDCAANTWSPDGHSLLFYVLDDNTRFAYRPLYAARAHWSAGFLILG